MLRHRLSLRTRAAPLQAYLGAVGTCDSTHTMSLLHEALWSAPAHMPSSEANNLRASWLQWQTPTNYA